MITLFITAQARKKLRYFTEECEDEISGLGKVKRIGPESFLFYDLDIFNQVVSAAHSTIDEEALGKFLYEKTKAGEKLSEYRMWWHSHAKMETFWSGTDTATIEKSTEFPWLISLVTNHKGDLLARLDVHDPIRHTVEDLNVVVVEDEDNDLREQCKKEIELKVRKGYEGRSFGFGSRETKKEKVEYLREDIPGLLPYRSQNQEEGEKTYKPGKGFRQLFDWDPETKKFVPKGETPIIEEESLGKGKGKYSRHQKSNKDQSPS